jgi:hypothetical protein
MKIKKSTCKTLYLTYKEFNEYINSLLKKYEKDIRFGYYEELIYTIVNEVINLYKRKRCNYIEFTTSYGEKIKGFSYRNLEFDIKYEVYSILDKRYFKDKLEKDN